ncbi:hypothetical protein ACPWT1_04775 [Ramlibacter sp. MMS24-I3-19]|uniref:hypothetical protein n=1 Tax=Ramlibacter sp. MMS24-I3-19 TaxID=3416606 RepID=UPI003D05E449
MKQPHAALTSHGKTAAEGPLVNGNNQGSMTTRARLVRQNVGPSAAASGAGPAMAFEEPGMAAGGLRTMLFPAGWSRRRPVQGGHQNKSSGSSPEAWPVSTPWSHTNNTMDWHGQGTPEALVCMGSILP